MAGEFKQLTGLAARTAERLLKECLDRGLLLSDSPKGLLRLGTPHWALRWLYPRLWPEAEAEV